MNVLNLVMSREMLFGKISRASLFSLHVVAFMTTLLCSGKSFAQSGAINEPSKLKWSEITLDVGSYQLKGIEGGLSTGIQIWESSLSKDFPKSAVLVEPGIHRSRWKANDIEYNRFSASLDLRLDVYVSPLATIYGAYGFSQNREWFKESEHSLNEIVPQMRVGTSLSLADSLALRIEYAPSLGSIRTGLSIKL